MADKLQQFARKGSQEDLGPLSCPHRLCEQRVALSLPCEGLALENRSFHQHRRSFCAVFQHHMSVCAAEAKGREARGHMACNSGQFRKLHRNDGGEILQVAMRIQALEVKIRCGHPKGQRRYDLHQSCQSRSCLQVANIRLHCAEGQLNILRTAFAKGISKGSHLDRVSQGCPRPMRLDGRNRAGLQLCLRKSHSHNCLLGRSVWRCLGGAATILVHSRAF